jgi:hypothetical protein
MEIMERYLESKFVSLYVLLILNGLRPDRLFGSDVGAHGSNPESGSIRSEPQKGLNSGHTAWSGVP